MGSEGKMDMGMGMGTYLACYVCTMQAFFFFFFFFFFFCFCYVPSFVLYIHNCRYICIVHAVMRWAWGSMMTVGSMLAVGYYWVVVDPQLQYISLLSCWVTSQFLLTVHTLLADGVCGVRGVEELVDGQLSDLRSAFLSINYMYYLNCDEMQRMYVWVALGRDLVVLSVQYIPGSYGCCDISPWTFGPCEYHDSWFTQSVYGVYRMYSGERQIQRYGGNDG